MEQLWQLNNLDSIGGNSTEVLGAPQVVEGPAGMAIEFGGAGDGLIVDVNPLAGAKRFTLEVIFQPYAGGLSEQRFIHLQEYNGDNRALIETRLTRDGKWFLDTYIKSAVADQTLFAEGFKHPLGPWYRAALVFDGEEMRHYVNGQLELAGKMPFMPLQNGRVSIGVRLNRVFWYRGKVSSLRFVDRALEVEEFLPV